MMTSLPTTLHGTLRRTGAALLLIGLAGCFGSEQVQAPDPVHLTAEDPSYFCGMMALGHPGPKMQIHLLGRDKPIWFAAARDGLGYLRLPEESEEVTAVYVSDMGAASWEDMAQGPWIPLDKAILVIESDRRGGMGAPAVVPFSKRQDADDYIAAHGGRVVALEDVPDDYILGMVDIPDEASGHGMPGMEPDLHHGDEHTPGSSEQSPMSHNEHQGGGLPHATNGERS